MNVTIRQARSDEIETIIDLQTRSLSVLLSKEWGELLSLPFFPITLPICSIN